MSSSLLVQHILNHPNSAFGSDDEAWLSKTPPEALQRMLLSMESAPITTTNADPVSALKEDLVACQSDLKNCLGEEQRILTELASHGIQIRSVLTSTGVPTNNAAPVLNDEIVHNYLTKNRTPLTTVVGEGMVARNETRRKSVDLILSHSNGVYAPQELEAMPTLSLQKLVSALQIQHPTAHQQWAGAAFADQTIPGTPVYTTNESDGEPLEMPNLWR